MFIINKKIITCLIICFIFIIFTSYSNAYSLSEIVLKEFPPFPNFFMEYRGCYKLIFYLPDSNQYELLYTSNPEIYFVSKENDINSYLFVQGFAERYQCNFSKNNWIVVKQYTASWDRLYFYNIRGHPYDVTNDNTLGNTYFYEKRELVYSDVDIKYTDSSYYFFRKPPLFKGVIFQHAIGGYVYQVFMMLAVPLLLFIVLICGFYKSFEFIYDILNGF